jgi:hypothetical protein
MPEPTDEELGLDPNQMDGLDPNIRAELRRSRLMARENAQLQAEAEQAKREAAFAKAGIPDTPLGEMFAKAYDGPTDDPSALKTAFEALGVATPLGGSTPPAQQGATDAAQRQLAQVGAGADLGGDIEFADALRSAKSEDDVLALIASAPEGARNADGYRIMPPGID